MTSFPLCTGKVTATSDPHIFRLSIHQQSMNSTQEKKRDRTLELTSSSGRAFPAEEDTSGAAGGALSPCRGACTTRCCRRDPAKIAEKHPERSGGRLEVMFFFSLAKLDLSNSGKPLASRFYKYPGRGVRLVRWGVPWVQRAVISVGFGLGFVAPPRSSDVLPASLWIPLPIKISL